jgi:hypothetical protein
MITTGQENEMKTTSSPLLKGNTKKMLDALNDEELEGMLEDDTRTLLLLVPGGVVAATLIGTDLAPDVVIAGLEQITACGEELKRSSE